MPPLSAELFGINSKERSFKFNETIDNTSDLVNQEFLNLKDAISIKNGTQTRNYVGPSRN